jgi:ATP/maltotriose-dependent transcriptional regulator MalT
MDRKATAQLQHAREHYLQRQWAKAFEAFVQADSAEPLQAADLELFSMCAYLIGRDDDYLVTLERAQAAYEHSGAALRSARCAFFLALRLVFRGEMGRATGWFARAARLVETSGQDDCAERGYLLVPVAERHLFSGEFEDGYAVAARAIEIGERCGEHDLVACARHLQGRARLQQGQLGPGLALLDETMLSVMGGKLSPLMTGLLYCSVIDGCRMVYAMARAREWTYALSEWCDQQPEMVAFTGTCLVHRAEILRLHGAWQEAIEEAERARDRCVLATNRRIAAAACYERGEIHRLRGDFDQAEEAFRNASEWGFEPQPGLALLRLAQGRTDLAAAASRRVMMTTTGLLERTRNLSAHVEIMLAAGDLEAARAACAELEAAAERLDAEVLLAMAAEARGAIELSGGDACAALGSLREACHLWRQLDAPYPLARVRAVTGLACRALGDEDGAQLEFDAARAEFERLGAVPDVAYVERIAQATSPGQARGLTARELQVLRLVATGMTNKGIAGELSLSEKTIDRHLSNIFIKLEVSSRAAATAYAYQHQLL